MAKDEAGFKKPPKKNQFKKGKSGNPAGRPKKSLNFRNTLDDELAETVTITEKGQKRQVSKLEAAIKQLVNQAATGNHKALQLLVRIKGEEALKALKEPLPWNDDDVP